MPSASVRNRIAHNLINTRLQIAARMAAELRRFFRGQSARVTKRLLSGKSLKQFAPLGVLVPTGEDALLRAALRPYLEQGIITASEQAALLAGATEVLPNRHIAPLIMESSTQIVRINATTRHAVRDALVVAEEAGYTTFQAAYGVPQDGFRGIQAVVNEYYRGRAEAIARTEIANVSQRAAITTWREMGVTHQDIIDGEDDEECSSRNDTRVSIEEMVETAHPNCTVVSLPVVDEAVSQEEASEAQRG